MYICFLFEGTSPLAATTYAKHTCPHPTPSGQEHHKHSTKKKAKPGTYHPATHQQFTKPKPETSIRDGTSLATSFQSAACREDGEE